MALLMGPAPSCAADPAPAWEEWSAPALSMAAERGACPSQWGTASAAEAIRAKPATVTTAQAGLRRSAGAIGDR